MLSQPERIQVVEQDLHSLELRHYARKLDVLKLKAASKRVLDQSIEEALAAAERDVEAIAAAIDALRAELEALRAEGGQASA